MEPDPVMENFTEKIGQLGGSSKRIARRLMTIGENRLELLLLEAVEERVRFIRLLLLSLGIFASGLLAMMTLTAAVVIALWAHSPVIVLVSITVLDGLITLVLLLLLRKVTHQEEPFSATFDQLRKDHACIEKALS